MKYSTLPTSCRPTYKASPKVKFTFEKKAVPNQDERSHSNSNLHPIQDQARLNDAYIDKMFSLVLHNNPSFSREGGKMSGMWNNFPLGVPLAQLEWKSRKEQQKENFVHPLGSRRSYKIIMKFFQTIPSNFLFDRLRGEAVRFYEIS